MKRNTNPLRRLVTSGRPDGWKRLLRLGAATIAVVSAAVSVSTPAFADVAEGQIRTVGTADVVRDSYIVVLKDAMVTRDRVDAKSRELGSRFSGRVGHTYRDAIRGFEIKLPAPAARRLAADPAVAYVQENSVVRLADTSVPAVQSPTPSWGLDRIDQRSPARDDAFGYPTDAAGVTAYIIDSGIRFTHHDFGGRAVSGIDLIDGGAARDFNGHGTHVAGIVGGATYGVAKGVTLVAVRIADAEGNGLTSDAIAGVDWVTADHQPDQPAVANMSLSTGTGLFSQAGALDSAVRNSIADGIVYGVAAGNQAGDACDRSPARVPEAITVGSTSAADERLDSSNVGSCVDIFAPGEIIASASHTDDDSPAWNSGTSMATPHVVGAAAVVLGIYPSLASLGPLTASYVRDYLVLTEATTGVVTGAGPESPNRLLYLHPLLHVGLHSTPDQSTQVNVPFTRQVSAYDGYQPYALSATGLPPGVTFDVTTGVISGTPTAIGTYGVVYTVRDGRGQVRSSSFFWTVTEQETRLFTATGTGSKPTTAISSAASRAGAAATAAGFGSCEMVDSSVELNEFGSYDASATLLCLR